MSTQNRFLKYNQWIFIILALIFGAVSVSALRSNNINAIALRDQVLEIDKNGGNTEKALQELRSYIFAHMNTNLATSSSVYPPIQLKYTYDRLKSAEKTRVDAENAKIYTEAYQLCEGRFPNDFNGTNRVPCVNNYVAERGVAERPIAEDLYKFNFASPVWSPDLAGLSMLLSGFFACMGILIYLAKRFIQLKII